MPATQEIHQVAGRQNPFPVDVPTHGPTFFRAAQNRPEPILETDTRPNETRFLFDGSIPDHNSLVISQAFRMLFGPVCRRLGRVVLWSKGSL